MSEYIKGLVSVVMPTYKRSEKLERAIKSVLNQSYKKLELLLVNDNVPEDEYSIALLERVTQYEKDTRFHFITQNKHINGAVARNVGISKAKGEFIAFLDDDDWWELDKIERQVDKLNELSLEWGVVSCRIQQFDNERAICKLPKYRGGYIYKDVLMQQCDFATGTLMFRHDALDEVGYFDRNLQRNQDWQLLIMFTSKYKLYQLDEFLHCCDVSDSSNRPNGDNVIKYKKDFFRSIKPIFDTLSDNEKRCVYCITKFEIGYVYYLSGDIRNAIKYCFQIFKSLAAMKLILNKMIKKIKSTINNL